MYLYIFVYHLYSWVRLSLSVRNIMISPSFFYCRQIDSHFSIVVLNFGLTRTLRTQDSTEANERHKRESKTMVRESVRECACASDEGAAKEEVRESGLLRLGGNKRFGFNFFTFEIFIFLLLCFFSWVFFIVLFSS